MRVLYASRRSHIPQRVDGALYAAHTLLALVRRRGHACEAAVPMDLRSRGRLRVYRAARMLSGRRLLGLPDRLNGYVTCRAWENLLAPLIGRRLERFRPDLVLTQLEGCQEIT